MRVWLAPTALFALLLLAGLAAPPVASAHEIRPALLDITETSEGVFEVVWKVPTRGGRVLALEPTLPADWTIVGTGTGVAGLPGGGAVGDDHLFNFNTGATTDIIGLGGTFTVNITDPVGRYLMFETSNYSTTCCNGASIWEVSVDANVIPEPSAALMVVLGTGFMLLRRRRRS